MKSAKIAFRDGVPFSPEFDDIYFSTDCPRGESEYVFVSALEEIWNDKERFNVLEMGFGAGLNFLCTWQRFKGSGKFLNFVSIEAHPIGKDDLAQIYANLGVQSELSNELLKLYPPLIRGFHRLNLAPNITLTLCFGEAEHALGELSFLADAVFMDGFAPTKNEAMWSETACRKIANLCAKDAILCTYTASSAVQKALKNSGFEINLLKGYGKKRQMIRAIFKGERESEKEIWFSRFCDASNPSPKTALVIGGGVAGCVSAFKLRQMGLDVTIAEKRANIATNGSGNHCGILMPLITKPAVNLGRMHMNAFLQAVRFYEQNLSENEIEFTGVIDYAHEEKLVERLGEWGKFDADNGVFEINLTDTPHPSAFIKKGAKARPRKMCQAASSGIKTLLNHEFTGFESLPDGRVRADFASGESIVADILVLALGSESMEFLADYSVPLSSVRGQVTHIKPRVKTSMPLSAKGYICPEADGVQVVGATYDRNLFVSEPRASDDEKNLADVVEFLDTKFDGREAVNLGSQEDTLGLSTKCEAKIYSQNLDDQFVGEAANLSSNFTNQQVKSGENSDNMDAKTGGLNLDEPLVKEAVNLSKFKNLTAHCSQNLDANLSSNLTDKKAENVEIIGSKVGFRGYSGDRFALIGRLYDEAAYRREYRALLWTKGKPNQPPKYVPNVYLSAAHGSRGLGTAVLGAELICDLVFARPLCIEKSLFNDLHAARFLIRKLKKGLR